MNANTAPARPERVYADTLASDPPRVHLLIVQSTPFCNLKCKYCYLNDLTHKATASEETLDNLFRKLFRSGWVKRKVDLCWHAGEPTATGIDFYRKAHQIIERYRPRDVVVRPSLQTNGTLINQAWCEFFREFGMHVGLSIDGPRRITDLNRLNHAGRSAFDRIVAGLRLLKREEIPFAVIAVLSAESLRSAREIYDFFAEEGVERVAFNVEELEGEHVSGLKPGPDTWRAYRDFFAEFAALSAADGRVKSVREWENGFRSVFQNRTISPGALETIPDRNILVVSLRRHRRRPPRQYRDVLAGTAGQQERGLQRLHYRQRQRRRFRRPPLFADAAEDVRRHSGRRRDVSRTVRLLRRLRGRTADQQDLRERNVCKFSDQFLPDDPYGDHRSDHGRP